jgi:hypothetical protein
LDGFWVVFAEVGNRIVVWRKPAHQPHEFQVAFALFTSIFLF